MRGKRAGAWFVACAVASLALTSGPGAGAVAGSTPEPVPVARAAGEARVAVEKSSQPDVDPDHVLVRRKGERHWATVPTPGGRAAAVSAQLARAADVAEVAPNYRRHAAYVPNDPGYSGVQTEYLSRLRVERAWERTTDGDGIIIAVLDSGIDANHPEFSGQLVAGWDFVNDDSNPNDDLGHGTMVAGVIAARTNNSRGIAGIAGNASIMPLKVLDSDGGGDDADLVDAIEYAADHGADVINMSLGGPGQSEALDDAIDYAIGQDIVVVAAAGNGGGDFLSYPAAYEPVIAVAATGDDGTLAYFSNWGWWVDLAAPGIQIVSTFPAAGTAEAYEVASGTSFASPIVAGIVALARAEYPGETAAQISDRVLNAAKDRGPYGIDPGYGRGTVDALASSGGLPPSAKPRTLTAGTDDTIATALTTTSATKSITPEGDEEWFSFTATSTGAHRIRVTPSAPTGVTDPRGFDAMIDLYDANEQLLKSVDTTFVDEQETLNATLTSGQTYYARVHNYHASISTGTYAFSVSAGGSGGVIASGVENWIHGSTPMNHSVNNAPNFTPTVVFNRAVDAATVTNATVLLLDRTGATVPAVTGFFGSTATITPSNPLPNGPYVVRMLGVEDADGDVLDASYRFAVGAPDIVAPITKITSKPSATTTSSTATFTFSSNDPGATFLCRVDKGSWHGCTSPKQMNVGKGTHTFRVFARDAAGNEDSPVKATWKYQ